MARYDIVIRGGLIVDGARNPRYKGDVAIKDGRIARMGRVPRGQAEREIDAEGLVVAPGFIDLHTHYDAQVFWDPYLTTSGTNGVTSVVIGNCGFGFAPMREEHRERAMQSMTKVEAIPLATLEATMPWDWVTYPEMLDSIDRAPKAVNLLPYIGVNPMLIWVMGLEEAKSGRKPTAEETEELKRLLHEAMDAGACGWSTQTLGTPGDPTAETAGGAAQSDYDGTPMPSDVMWPETLRAFAEVLGERGEGFVEMSAAHLPREIWEELAEVSGAPFIYQALPASDMMIEMNEDLFAWFERCREKGLRIYGQGITQNPPLVMTFDYWDLWGPVWTQFTGPEVPRAEKLANLADPAIREKLRAEPLKHMLIASIDQAKVNTVAKPGNERFVGKTIGEIAEELGKHPVDAICDLVVSDELETSFALPQFDIGLDGLKQLLGNPWIIPGLSDGGAHLKYLAAGSYATELIAEYVRKHAILSLEEAHWRLSALPAFCAGFRDRGVLREGAAADIVVYDYENLAYEFPNFVHDLPGDEYRVVSGGQGYRYVLVNGQVTIEDDEPTHVHSGELLRGGRGRADRASA
ncbi:MAG: amidohydrolase family protein [Myxococcales bacterium]|nr:amidohydrolase family protein [Myxococcales bacterium]